MDTSNYINEKKDLHSIFLQFIDKENDYSNEYQNLIDIYEKQKIKENRNELSLFLHLISKITKNHHRNADFSVKIEKIFHFIEEEIKINFTNSEIFRFFKNNKNILLLLIKQKILIIDQSISKYIFKKGRKENIKLCHFFHPEIEFHKERINKQLSRLDQTTLENFDEKRQIGENDSFICSLIRNDSVIEFISYVNKNNVSLSSTIRQSIYETNSFLLKNKETTLIEYAAFFGSIQIFNYLKMNEVELKPSLWLYSIHGKNAELIHLLEENKVEPDDKSFKQCFKEAIKCHHNDIANYIKDNLMDESKNKNQKKFDRNEEAFAFHYHNYFYLQNNFNHKSFFYYACKYDYITIVDILLQTNKINLNDKIILILFY